MDVGFARATTGKQIAGSETQLRDRAGAVVEKLFSEQIGSIRPRTQLDAALAWVRAATLRHLTPNIDTRIPEGRLMLTMLGGLFRFERESMLKCRREGIAKAEAERQRT